MEIHVDFSNYEPHSEAAQIVGQADEVEDLARVIATALGWEFEDYSILCDEIRGLVMSYVDGRA